MEEAAKYIEYLLTKRHVSFFVGAGISKESGVPLAEDLSRMILRQLEMKENEIDHMLKDTPLALEIVLSNLTRFFDILPILDVFKGTRPTYLHRALAQLVKRGYIKTIATTNYDRLLEIALTEIGLEENKDFIIITRSNKIDELQKPTLLSPPRILKLHGSIEKPEGILATIEDIQSSIQGVSKAVKWLFSYWPLSHLVVMGYKFADVYDISPVIENKLVTRKKLLVIQHKEAPRVSHIEPISTFKDSYGSSPLSKFKGAKISFLTKDLLTLTLENMNIHIEKKKEAYVYDADWRAKIEKWGESKRKNSRFYVLLFKCYNLSVDLITPQIHKFQNELVQEARNSADRIEIAQRLIKLALAERTIFHNNLRARSCYIEALKLGTQLNDDEVIATSNIGVAETYRGIDKEKSREYYKAGISLLEKFHDEQTILTCLFNGDSQLSYRYFVGIRDSIPLKKLFPTEVLEAILNGEDSSQL